MAKPVLRPSDLTGKTGKTLLEIFCEEGEFDELFTMIDSGVIQCTESVTRSGAGDHQLLHFAAAHGNLEVVSALVDKYKCDPNGNRRVTPLHYAALYGHLEVVQYLVSVGCRPNQVGGSALHYACYGKNMLHIKGGMASATFQHVKIVQFLISHGWNFRQKNASGNEPLIVNLILTNGTLEDLKFLVNQGFSIASLRGKVRTLMQARGFLSKPHLYFSNTEIVDYLVSIRATIVTPELVVSMAKRCHDSIVLCMTRSGTNSSVPAYDGSFYDIVSPTIHHSLVLLDYICQNGHFSIFKAIAENNLNFQDSKGRSLLHIACEHNKHDFVSFLVRKGCDLNLTNHNKQLPLHVACKHASVGVVNLVTYSDIINNQDVSGNTPLHIACMCMQYFNVTFLVNEMCCRQDIVNEKGALPLHVACMGTDVEMVKLVSDVDMNKQDASGNTPLHIACMGTGVGVIEYLAIFCRQNILNCMSELPLHILASSGRFALDTIQDVSDELTNSTADIGDHDGNTPLHRACKAKPCDLNVIEYLACELQCRLDKPNGSGELPLNILTLTSHHVSNYTSLVIRIISTQPDFNINAMDGHGNALLHMASSKNCLDLVRYLILERKCNTNLVNGDGELPLHIACRHRSIEMVKLVCNGISEGSLLTKNQDQNTPLHIVLNYGHWTEDCKGIVRYLVFDKGCLPTNHPGIFADLNVVPICADEKDYYLLTLLATSGNVGHDCLTMACEKNNVKAAKLLQTLRYIHSSGILHIACSKSLEMVKLVIHEDDVNATDSKGNSPLHLACSHNQVSVIELLVTKYNCDQFVRNFNYFRDEDELPLHLACAQSLDAVKLLTVDLSYLSVVSKAGFTPFHVACVHSKLNVVQYLLQKLKGDINSLIESTKSHPLQLACEKGNVEIVKCLIENGVNTSRNSSDGNTPMHIACSSGSFEVVKYLIDSGHDTLVQNLRQELPLHIACSKSLELVEIISFKCTIQELESKAFNDVTPLHIASVFGSLEIVKYLIEVKKCSPLTLDSKGRNSLAYASGFSGIEGYKNLMYKNSSPDVVRYLIRCGCSPTEQMWLPYGYNISPILNSINTSAYDLFKALVEGGSHMNYQDEKGNTLLMVLCQKTGAKNFVLQSVLFLLNMGCNQQIRNKKNELALHIACEYNTANIITLLDPSYAGSINSDGNTALHIACARERCSKKVVEHLLICGTLDCNIQNNHGQVPLHLAARRNPAVLMMLCKIKGRFDSTIKDNSGSAPIHCARISKEVLRALLDHDKANLELKDAEGNSPLHIFCHGANESCVELLLSRGASTAVMNNDGDTPLHVACRTRFSKVVNTLIRKGAGCVPLKNKAGDTPLHIACRQKNLVLVKALCKTPLRSGLTVSNSLGNTPLHVACTVACLEIVNFLTETQEQCPTVLTRKNMDGAIPFHIALELLCQHSVQSRGVGILKGRQSSISFDTALSLSHGPWPKEVGRLLCFFTNYCEDINVQNANGETLLHLACKVSDHYALGLVSFFVQRWKAEVEMKDMHSQFPLHIAASRSLEMVKLCYKEAICNAQDNSGNTPLHIACLNGRGNVINYLLATQKCISNVRNRNGRLPLHCAFLKTDTLGSYLYKEHISNKTIHLLVQSTLRLEQNLCLQDVNGDTPLHLACKFSLADWVLALKQYNVGNLSVQNNIGQTSLHIACIISNLEIAQTLLNCDPRCKLKQDPCDTALHIACKKHSLDIIQSLLESKHKAASNIPNLHGELPIHVACRDLRSDSLPVIEALSRHVASIDSQTNTGDTPLHLAVRHHGLNFEIIKFLTDFKCNISVTNNDGDTPLHIACRSKFLPSQIIKLLASKDNINLQNNNKNTAVHEFCTAKEVVSRYSFEPTPQGYADVESLRCLIEFGAKLDTPNTNGQYPMHLACRFMPLEVIKLLEPYGLAVKTKNGNTVLHEACGNPSYGQVGRYFLSYTPALDLASVNSDGDLALHIACREYLPEDMLDSFIKGNHNVNVKNKNGDTPFHELIKSRQSSNVATLLRCEKCDLGIINNQKESPLFLACKKNLTATVRLLIEKIPEMCHQADKEGQTPIMVTTNAEIVNLLLENGANPAPLYEMHRKYFEKYGSSNSPMKTPVSVLVIGHPCAGKTTLVSSLKKEKEDDRAEEISRTAGIVPNDFSSHIYGQVIMYDFAGQPEYYASHDAVIHNIIKRSPPIVLLVVDLTLSIKETTNIVSYWSDIVKNRLVSLTDKAHLYIICSHADVLEQMNINPKLKTEPLLRAVETKLNEIKQLRFQKMITMDCTNPQSKHINDLRMLLADSTNQLRHKGVINFQSHCLSTFLKQTFQNEIVIPLDKLAYRASIATRENLIGRSLIPDDLALLKELCRELSDGGIIVFLEDPTVQHLSWIVLNKVALLNDVCGKLFAPESFPEYTGQHGSNTGVLCYSKLKQIFPHYNPNMLFGFLCRMEYCQEIQDEKVLEHMLNIEKIFSEYERYYFFPSFVKIERPQKEWTHLDRSGYQIGWIMKCTTGMHFSPSFVQILLLRLMFGSTQIKRLPQAPLDIHSVSTVWKSGILWSNTKGIDTVVDVIENSKLLVLIHCKLKDTVHCLHHRSTLLQAIRCIKEEICPAVVTEEFFITPKYIHHPLKLDNADRILISLDDIITSVSEGHDYVYSASNDKVSLGDLLLFDPYIHLCDSLSAKIFSLANSNEEPNDKFLMALSCHLCEHFDLFLKIIRPAPIALEGIDQLRLTEKFRRLFKLWLRRIGRTFESIHNEFCRITIFKTDTRPPGIYMHYIIWKRELNCIYLSQVYVNAHLDPLHAFDNIVSSF